MSKRSIIKYLLVITWMITIFLFSSKPATDSNEQSYTVGRIVCTVVYPDFTSMPSVEQEQAVLSINYIVRKTAHFIEYMILGILLFIALDGRRKVLPFTIGMIYAGTDEFHQLFVSGRSGQIKDVALDSVGVLFGVFLIAIIYARIKKRDGRNW
ncbi:MAG: VanZ family protein [Velocimicrobium sp.]